MDSSDSLSEEVSSSLLVSVSSSLVLAGGGVGVVLFCKKRLWKGLSLPLLDPVEDWRVREGASPLWSTLPRAKYFCFTSSAVYAAPVLRTAEPLDSLDVEESELVERVAFLGSADVRRVVAVCADAPDGFTGVLRCWGADVDSSDSSSALVVAYRKINKRKVIKGHGHLTLSRNNNRCV